MIPYLHIWHFTLPTFGLMLWLAAVTGAFIMDRSFRRAHVTADALGIVAVTVVCGIVGAKLWHVLDTPADFRALGWPVRSGKLVLSLALDRVAEFYRIG